ncbi:uncharacterized protein LOC132700097 [Cylas formicarius]|uniref:uncharacterized protein LOC132700097 n=1 Tax=Cylas formicarius TaxID=197179 RepID=UPI0029587F4B|nr:uncharacterized protein LOC132700097 [Cylas formicarius]
MEMAEQVAANCEVCHAPTERRCSGCKAVFYCSPEHQRNHWSAHKRDCGSYEIRHCKELGRYMVAKRDLEPGDVIFVDSPLVVGPKRDEHAPLVCVGCCKLLKDVIHRCPECLWPACASNCEGLKNPSLHACECQVIKLQGADPLLCRLDVLIVLRALFLQKTDQKKWKTLLSLEDHLEERRPGTGVFEDVQQKVCYIQNNFLAPLRRFEESTGQIVLPQVSNDIVHKIYGALDVNEYELTGSAVLELLYPIASISEHSCVPNCLQVIDESDNYKLTCRAASAIARGAHIKACYTDLLKGTQERQRYLRETKYFTCTCERCSDPTEMGTFFSGLVCLGTEQEPCKGLQLPDQPTTSNPKWVCDRCGIRLPNDDVVKFVRHLGHEVDKQMEKRPKMEELEDFLNKLLTFLHPNHYLVYRVKHSLVQLYKTEGELEISRGFLETKLEMCEDLIWLTRKIDPGNARLGLYLAVLLYEKYQAQSKLLTRTIEPNDIGSWESQIQNVLKLLLQSKMALRYELQSDAGSKLHELLELSEERFKSWLNSIGAETLCARSAKTGKMADAESCKCAECGEPAALKCSACKLASYCGKEHQKSHWKDHRAVCRPFEIVVDPDIGRCLVATRDLKPGDLILTENPLVFGPRPHMVEEGPVPCPGCCRLIIGEGAARCEGCDFPVCNPECPGLKDMEVHGHECMILGLRDVKAINGLHDFYRQDTLLPLRCILLQNRHPKKFAKLMGMESHLEKRGENTEIYRDIDSRVVDYLNDNFFVPMRMLEGKSGRQVLEDISKQTIHKICGILDVNALEINQDSEVTALYPNAYLMEHSCVHNTRHSFESAKKGYVLTVKASVPISKGDHISTMYTHTLWGTQARREHLKETKYFTCKCRRCGDPTELGSYLSALKCIGNQEEPCGGIQLPVDPLDDNTEWTCDKCDVKLSNAEVSFLVNQIGEEVDHVQLSNPTVRDLDGLLTKMLNFVQSNHYHAYSVKHSLVQLYGYQQGYLPNQLTDDCLAKKAAMARELLDINKKIDPATSRLALYSGVLLHELYLANMILIKRKWDLGIKTKVKSINSMLKECDYCLKNAVAMLSDEKNSPAGEKLVSLVESSAREFEKFVSRNKIDLSAEKGK